MVTQGWEMFFVWSLVCGLGMLLCLAGEQRANTPLSATGKLIAASAYIAAALSLGAGRSPYGQVLILGMAFCWLGDLFLVSRNSPRLFLAGLASFLTGHLVYIAAFAVRGVSFPALLITAVAMVVFGWAVLRWLGPYLDARMRGPVWFYVIAISAMMAMAAATHAAHASLVLLLGGVLFVLSDLGVARNRFVAPGIINRVLGLPLYFAAQLLLAASVSA
jgi:uncharacterized membrane protein YhhN